MHFTILNGIFCRQNIHHKAVITIGLGLACVIPLGKNRYVFKSLQVIFSKDKDKGLI